MRSLTRVCASAAVTNQYAGNVYKAIPNTTSSSFPYFPNDVQGDTILACECACAVVLHRIANAVADYDLETRIWLNFVVQIIMIFGYRAFAWIYMSLFIRGKK